MHRVLASPFVRGVLGALVVVLVLGWLLVTIHLWSDHQALHTVVDYLNRHAATINQLSSDVH